MAHASEREKLKLHWGGLSVGSGLPEQCGSPTRHARARVTWRVPIVATAAVVLLPVGNATVGRLRCCVRGPFWRGRMSRGIGGNVCSAEVRGAQD